LVADALAALTSILGKLFPLALSGAWKKRS